MNEFSLSPCLYRLIDLHPMSVPHLSTLCYRVPRYPESRYVTGPWTICDLRHTNWLPNSTALIYPAGQHRTKTTHATFMPHHPHYTTPTPEIPILREISIFGPNFERDSCIRTPIFRWTPLPEAIPSRRNDPNFHPIFQFLHYPQAKYSMQHTKLLNIPRPKPIIHLMRIHKKYYTTTRMITCHIVISHEYLSPQVYTFTPRYQISTF